MVFWQHKQKQKRAQQADIPKRSVLFRVVAYMTVLTCLVSGVSVAKYVSREFVSTDTGRVAEFDVRCIKIKSANQTIEDANGIVLTEDLFLFLDEYDGNRTIEFTFKNHSEVSVKCELKTASLTLTRIEGGTTAPTFSVTSTTPVTLGKPGTADDTKTMTLTFVPVASFNTSSSNQTKTNNDMYEGDTTLQFVITQVD